MEIVRRISELRELAGVAGPRMTRATVLVPTFDHGPTLKYAVRSALDQTVADIEIFIVGDGVPPLARSYIEELVKEDSRVRLFINDKGPRHGEIHRARALEEASGEIVCYLSDDDLWLPDHLAVMSELLEDADFAHCLPIRVEPGGRIGGWPIDLAEKADRQLLLGGENRIPLSCSGHTLAAYRRLPHGWRTTPDNVPTDLYMFQQFLVTDWVRTVSGSRPTCLHFPSPDRFDWSSERRLAELAWWADRMADVEWRQRELTRAGVGCGGRRMGGQRSRGPRSPAGTKRPRTPAPRHDRAAGSADGLASIATRTRWCS